MAEDDRVGDLHHRGLEVHREQHALLAGLGDLRGEERVERGGAHDGGVDDLARLHPQAVLEDGGRAVGADVLDAQRRRARRSVTDVSEWRKSPSVIVETWLFVSGDQAPIECGCFLA